MFALLLPLLLCSCAVGVRAQVAANSAATDSLYSPAFFGAGGSSCNSAQDFITALGNPAIRGIQLTSDVHLDTYPGTVRTHLWGGGHTCTPTSLHLPACLPACLKPWPAGPSPPPPPPLQIPGITLQRSVVIYSPRSRHVLDLAYNSGIVNLPSGITLTVSRPCTQRGVAACQDLVCPLACSGRSAWPPTSPIFHV